MRLILIFLFLAFNVCDITYAQNQNRRDLKLDNEHKHSHAIHKNEIGVANSPVYLINEKVFSYGLHFHYIRNIKKSAFGLGLGYERIFDEHNHNTFGLVIRYIPVDKLSLIVAPGILYEDRHFNKPEFAIHLESVYEFEIKNIGIGPVVEFAYATDDLHISLGLHLGFVF